ncbi:MAG: DUF2249 domain-containing protein [Bdellovibrionales bacterium]|nr:DUF2249 domain-containing protein [Bdellovibrionales bacterium]
MKEFIIEAQTIPPRERHGFIFQSFDNLEGGDSLVIVNNHDPIPLLRQFQEVRPEQFAFEYLEQGPKTWRLRLTKKAKEGCCGFCGS